jgi:type II secretory pathway component GspD/PulD (secretin)
MGHTAFAQQQATPPPPAPAATPVAPAQAPTPQAATGANSNGPVVTRVYAVKYATPIELAKIVTDLIPGIKAVLGPQPKFVRDTPSGELLGVDMSSTEAIKASVARMAEIKAEKIENIPDQFVRNLILRGPESAVNEALETLKQIDLPAPQVLIEAKIIDMSEETAEQIGVSWDFAPNGTTATFRLDRPASPNEGKPWPQVVFGRLTRDPIEFTALLEAAITNDKAHLLASPRLVVLYNHRARIFIGDEVTYLVGTVASQNGPTLETGKVSTGVELNVVATANADGSIDLKVNPEVGNLLQLQTLPNGVSLPKVSRRTVTTAVRVNDGDTLVIGGLNAETDTKAVRKVPILGDIPLFGWLFRHSATDKLKSEVVIFLRASIIKDGALPPVAGTKDAALPPASRAPVK